MKYWKLFFNPPKVKTNEAIQPTDEPRECAAADTSIARLEALGQWDAAVEKACSTLAALHAPPRATARVFLMDLSGERIAVAVRYLEALGYRMKFRGKHVEMIHG